MLWEIHYDGRKLFDSVAAIQRRARGAAGEVMLEESAETRAMVTRQLDELEAIRAGFARQLEQSRDADRVVFGYARQPDWPPPWCTPSGDFAFELRGHEEPIQLFEIGVDGSGLRQLTDHPVWNSLEPTYCADGSIVFASDRSGRSSECGRFSADHTVINLYRITTIRILVPQHRLVRAIGCVVSVLGFRNQWVQRHFLEHVHAQNL